MPQSVAPLMVEGEAGHGAQTPAMLSSSRTSHVMSAARTKEEQATADADQWRLSRPDQGSSRIYSQDVARREDTTKDTAGCGRTDKGDVEASPGTKEAVSAIDIEHEPVEDDPRSWSSAFRWAMVAILCAGALIPTMGANIFFPAIGDVKIDLQASDSSIALSISLFILAQGMLPLVWSPISEIFGRKPCFLIAMGIFTVSMAIVGGAAQSMAMLIAFRVIGAGGSSALLAISAGSLADMYEPAERGIKVGIYYCSPLLGPAFAPIIGGLLTNAGAAPGEKGTSGWRLTFIFIAACGAASFISYCFFRETFRTERSIPWQNAKRAAVERARKRPAHNKTVDAAVTLGSHDKSDSFASRLRGYLQRVLRSARPVIRTSEREQAAQITAEGAAPKYMEPGSEASNGRERGPRSEKEWNTLARKPTTRHSISRTVVEQGEAIKFRPSLSDVSPLGSAVAVLKQPHNIIALIESGLSFASQYSLSYTATRTFAAAPYNLDPIEIGLVLLALGGGGMIGSILGGRLSDRELQRVTQANKERLGDDSTTPTRAAAEHRLDSIRIPMLLCPPSFVGYAWSAEKKAHVAAPVVFLVLLGFSLFWIYAATLSYIVDSNTGRSSGAVACNSALRGLLAFVASEVAGPIQDAVGDGALYTGWAIILAIGQVGLVVVALHGERWRQPDWKWPRPWACAEKA